MGNKLKTLECKRKNAILMQIHHIEVIMNATCVINGYKRRKKSIIKRHL